MVTNSVRIDRQELMLMQLIDESVAKVWLNKKLMDAGIDPDDFNNPLMTRWDHEVLLIFQDRP